MAESAIQTRASDANFYPDSDGEPMGESDWHIQMIVLLRENLRALFASRTHEVYVANDLFWYPVEGQPKIVHAPDAMVVFGRPQYDRRVYKQWEENGIGPKVTFEVRSPTNTRKQDQKKREFYDAHGVDEHYELELLHHPQELEGWVRIGGELEKIPSMDGWTSPALGIRFSIQDGLIEMRYPDGRPFVSFAELSRELDLAQKRSDSEAKRADREARRAVLMESRAEDEAKRAEELARRLREAGIDPDEI